MRAHTTVSFRIAPWSIPLATKPYLALPHNPGGAPPPENRRQRESWRVLALLLPPRYVQASASPPSCSRRGEVPEEVRVTVTNTLCTKTL